MAFRYPDQWLFRHKSVMVYVWTVLVVLILFIPAWPSGFLSVAPFFSTVTISLTTRATLLLALGTFSLAYAALVQAVSTERARRYQISTGLELHAAVSPASIGTPMAARDLAVFHPPAGSISLYLANHGPGAACRLRVRYALGLLTIN